MTPTTTPATQKISTPLLPEHTTIGILGGGQLGKMSAMAAQHMGYKVITFCPESNPPAQAVSHKTIQANYTDEAALTDFCNQVDVVTVEFENIPASALHYLESHCKVAPSATVLLTTQHRLREKTFLSNNAIPVSPYQQVETKTDLENAIQTIGLPAVLKTAGFGYDGKGQCVLKSETDLSNPKIDAILSQPQPDGTAILEGFVDFDCEVSMVFTRTKTSTGIHFSDYGLCENEHHNHVLFKSLAPTFDDVDYRFAELESKARTICHSIGDALDLNGILCVEFFLTKQGELLVNEMAPRPHNSGHWTIEGTQASQFENHVRAVCALPAGNTKRLTNTVMVNLLGDFWLTQPNSQPDWNQVLADFPTASLHLYGKAEAREGRKMGHITFTGKTLKQANKSANQFISDWF